MPCSVLPVAPALKHCEPTTVSVITACGCETVSSSCSVTVGVFRLLYHHRAGSWSICGLDQIKAGHGTASSEDCGMFCHYPAVSSHFLPPSFPSLHSLFFTEMESNYSDVGERNCINVSLVSSFTFCCWCFTSHLPFSLLFLPVQNILPLSCWRFEKEQLGNRSIESLLVTEEGVFSLDSLGFIYLQYKAIASGSDVGDWSRQMIPAT